MNFFSHTPIIYSPEAIMALKNLKTHSPNTQLLYKEKTGMTRALNLQVNLCKLSIHGYAL